MIDHKEAIKRAEQDLAPSRMTPPQNGYIKIRPSDLEIFLYLARIATSPELTAMRDAAKAFETARRQYAAKNFAMGSEEDRFRDAEIAASKAAISLARAEVGVIPTDHKEAATPGQADV